MGQKDADYSCTDSVHTDEGALSNGLTTEQLEQIWSWNTPLPPTLEICMHELVAEQANKDPDQFAAHLISLGVRIGSIVPLCFEKSRWTVVAVLAPEGRLRTIVEQTGAVTIVTEHFSTYDTSSSLPSVPASTNLYIQFTSGSTGKPKDIVGYRAHSRVLDFASYAFDVCIDCMLCTLSVGGCLCIPSDADRMNVNMAHMTPSVARVLDPDIIPSLEVLGLGGEAISAGDAAAWSRNTKVINAYGPSDQKPHVSIGRGVGGTLWIVDPSNHNRLMPVGAVGELLVEGPIRTAMAFINDPKGRLYKTGDLVRYDSDGTIIFVGRGDQQIEYNMRDKLPPGTRVAAEVIRPGGPAERAGLVSESESLLGSLSPQALSEHLPIYMVPAAYIPLQVMPLLVSAKTDRKRLRELGHSLSRKDIAGFAAATKLAHLWTQVLGQDAEIGAHDNFFNLGGDSLRAMKLVAQARTQNVALTVADIFANPVLSDMALVARPGSSEASVEIPPFSLLSKQCLCDVDPSQIEDIYPCTPLQEGLMALSAKVSEAYVAQRVVELADEAAVRSLAKAFELASKDLPDYGLMQVVSLNDYLVQDRSDPVQLGKPLVRYGLVINEKLTGKSHFVLTMHHALYDGWSMPLVVERVNRAYNNLSTERPAEFKHFISYLANMNREESESFWRERLDGANGEQFPPLPYSGYQQQADSLLEHYVHTGKPTSGITIATVIPSNDVVFGETLTGRNAPIPGVEQIEGPMIATIPVRVAVHPDMTIKEYLQEIHDQSHIRRLSPDAREACELRTGLVLHPSADADTDGPNEKQPADGFVPAGDAEAAQEALKFNTYALMLVCSLDPQGYLIMASFDSKTVNSPQMERMLHQLGRITQQFIENPDIKCSELQLLTEADITELTRLSQAGAKSSAIATLIPAGCEASEAHVVDPTDLDRLLPPGAVGELLVRSSDNPNLEPVPSPKWAEQSRDGHFYRTRKLAKFSEDNSITFVERTNPAKIPATSSRQKRVSATSAKQKSLRQTWSRILAIDEDDIGLNDSFFQLGGDSIGAMKIVSELRAKGLELTVPEIFKHRTLYDMAKILREGKQATAESVEAPPSPFSLLDIPDVETFIAETVRPNLTQGDHVIKDIVPARPLQQVAVRGTTQLPRYSARYELFYFNGHVDKERLFRSCQELVARNEILRTVFVESAGKCFGVVLETLKVAIDQYEIEGDLDSFVHKLCDVDVQTKMPLGSAFVKFIFVQGEGNKSCLIFRISHAQYDEVCLPGLIRQLAGLYDGTPTPDSVPFSSFLYHVVKKCIPRSIPYWRDLLKDSSLTILRPDLPLTSNTPAALTRTIDISARLKDITVATLPTAAWALCLAQRLALRDVVFGEVVTGRNIDLPRADAVMGPTWQYVPVRVRFEDDWTAVDLLQYVQHQHIASAQHEGMGLEEIARECVPSWHAEGVNWFDSVVHQDVYHVENLKLGLGEEGQGADCRLETVYPHFEPLREWKVQAFVDAEKDSLMLEIVTFQDWIGVAAELLDELEEIVGILVRRPNERILP
ncbi:peptide synthetase [Hypoxylon sp. FL1857]|nr:peptide synthetase [Hypoxylon sp. FL1857]